MKWIIKTKTFHPAEDERINFRGTTSICRIAALLPDHHPVRL